ncbi:hypothetical protein CTA2_9951 [Colletotrichum tanaceti]|uniref:Uncharacterized protein n=1 Tax=Colletotrichum tanaceti TaxID=1306861 RepID=A0A4U6XJQ9_9PEZI|nr:hypothetical protein CTA2_9951 [Colletotrichum tanaceti]TKW55759.1 hypothetical protein CTA1_182 [Colletotrichum tanaceti]
MSDFIDLFCELRLDNKFVLERPANESCNLTELLPAAKAEGLLQKYFGQKSWTPFRESVEAGICNL